MEKESSKGIPSFRFEGVKRVISEIQIGIAMSKKEENFTCGGD